jgi:hypothetical protein
MTLRTLPRTFVVVVVVGALAVSCSSSSKKSSTTTTEGTKSFHVQTPEGQASLSLDGQLPPNWPAAFPVAPDSKPAGSGSLGGTATTTLVGVYTTTAPPESTYNFYKSTSAYKVDSASSAGVGKAFLGTVQFSGSYAGSATILSVNGTTYIVVVLHTGGAASTTTSGTATTTTTAAGATATTGA